MHTNSAKRGWNLFIHTHDEYPAFHAGFLVLTLLIAALFNLGMFALLIAVHMGLDYVKYTERHRLSSRKAMIGVLSESIIDITLLMVGLVFAVYLHHSAGLIAASGLLRAGGYAARGLGIVVPKLEVLYHFTDTLMNPQEHMDHFDEEIRARWTMAMTIATCAIASCIALLAIAPGILAIDTMETVGIIVNQMTPWNF